MEELRLGGAIERSALHAMRLRDVVAEEVGGEDVRADEVRHERAAEVLDFGEFGHVRLLAIARRREWLETKTECLRTSALKE